MLTAMDQKPQMSLKRWHYPPSHCLNVNVMQSNMTFLLIFAVFDTSPLTQWINWKLIDSIDRLDFSWFCRSTRLGWKLIDSIDSLPTVSRPIHFFAAQLQLSSVFYIVMSVCLSQPWTALMVTRQPADMPTREITRSLCKNDGTHTALC